MTGIPDELILMGDNFESDPVIYLTLVKILTKKVDPWSIWNSIREEDIFKLKRKQNSQLLNKIFQLNNLITRKKKQNPEKNMMIKIYIRKRFEDDQLSISTGIQDETKLIELIEMYNGTDQDIKTKGAENKI
jgi:hypothetical protein